MTLPTLFTAHFWFTPTPPPFVPSTTIMFFGLVMLMLIVGIGAYVMRSRVQGDKLARRMWDKIGTLFISTGLVGLLLYALGYEQIPFLGMRFLVLVWLVWVGLWAWQVWRFAYREIPEMRRERAEREKFTKWLPKKR